MLQTGGDRLYHFKNLVFEGGGVKGIAYVGAMQELENRQILQSIERIGGTSAGAINAVLFGLRYSSSEIKSILMNQDFSIFLDDSWGFVRNTYRLITKFGWYEGDFFRNWIGSVIKEKTGNTEATFSDLRRLGFRDMYFVGTNLSTSLYEVFSFEHTPLMSIADAVRISMSIPLFFAAPKNVRGDIYSDGGILDNYPIKLFDRAKYVGDNFTIPDYYRRHNLGLITAGSNENPYVFNQETLGFRLASKTQIEAFRDQREPIHHTIDNFFGYITSLVSTVLNQQECVHLHSDDWQRSIYIDSLGVGVTDFHIDASHKEALIESGRSYTQAYFKWYDKPKSNPVNRPGKEILEEY